MKITKSILKKIIKEEILREMMDNPIAKMRQFAADDHKNIKNIIEAYKLAGSIQNENMKIGRASCRERV